MLVTEVETALERQLSSTIMRGEARPRKRRLQAGETLTEQNAPGAELYLLLDGVLGVEVSGEPVAEVGPGAILGERAVLEGGRRTATLRAVTACKVAVPTKSTARRWKRWPGITVGRAGSADVRVHLCGTRGSTPAPGRDFVRYGGHTSCVALAHDGQVPSLVLDTGTGLREVGRLLDAPAFHGTVLLTQLHWDHTHGLPFFRAGDHPDARVALYLPGQGDGAEATLARAMSPPSFPIRPSQLGGDWCFTDSGRASTSSAAFGAGTGGPARGWPHVRLQGVRRSQHPGLPPRPPPPVARAGTGRARRLSRGGVRLVGGVDVLLHDAQYTAEEFAERAHFGHSAVDYAVGLAAGCGVGELVLVPP